MTLTPVDRPLVTVYGSLMHHRAELEALGDTVHQPPYLAPPQSSVLYIKPANTFSRFDENVPLPAGQMTCRARACLGLFFKKNRSIAGIEHTNAAIDFIANDMCSISLLCDFTMPHESFHRPPVKFNAFDGSLSLPQHGVEATSIDLKNSNIETWVNGIAVHHFTSADWIISAAQHLQAVGEFIAFEAGDVLMMGCPPDAPLVRSGDVVETRLNGHTFTRNAIIEALI